MDARIDSSSIQYGTACRAVREQGGRWRLEPQVPGVARPAGHGSAAGEAVAAFCGLALACTMSGNSTAVPWMNLLDLCTCRRGVKGARWAHVRRKRVGARDRASKPVHSIQGGARLDIPARPSLALRL